MLRRTWLFVAPLLVLAACGDPHTRTRSQAAPIIGGSVDNGDPAVVALYETTQGALCTSEIITPTVIITAAHCVAEAGTNGQYLIISGSDVNSGQQLGSVASVHWDQAFDINAPQNGHDVGIVILAPPGITNITPLPWNRTPMSQTMVGQNVRLVGYGLSDPVQMTGAGTKRQVTTTLDDFDSLLLHIGRTGQDSCQGDSGGPAFMQINGVETIVGVTSFGEQGCGNGGYYTRLDQYAQLINTYVTGMCMPQCAGKMCGADGCGGSCGGCGASQTCTPAGQCMTVCTPQCAGKTCGADGCGGQCGSCGTGQMCTNPAGGTCVSTNPCDRAGGNETEPNDTQSAAGVLCSDFTIQGSISSPTDVDWYTWPTPPDQQYTVHLTGLSHDTELSLLKMLNGQLVWIMDGVNNHDNADQAVSLYSETGGTYYVMVRGVNGAFSANGAKYKVQITFP